MFPKVCELRNFWLSGSKSQSAALPPPPHPRCWDAVREQIGALIDPNPTVLSQVTAGWPGFSKGVRACGLPSSRAGRWSGTLRLGRSLSSGYPGWNTEIRSLAPREEAFALGQ